MRVELGIEDPVKVDLEMVNSRKKLLVSVAVIAVAALFVWALFTKLQEDSTGTGTADDPQSVPVETAPVERGPIEMRRTFSGTLEARAEFVVAPKMSGRVEHIDVDLADMVTRGQVVAELDDEEYVQAVAESRAELEVEKANLAEARASLETAKREFARVDALRGREIASESQIDEARANRLRSEARLEVAKAEVMKAEASLETANIRLGYTKVTASWTGGSDRRVVARRFVDEGETVSANTPLLLIVELDPITGVIYATEKDYGRLAPGQTVTLSTDAFPAERFEGRIERVAPVFRESTRQARVEMTITNHDRRLKPGMFIRATVVLDRVAEATTVPEAALTTRADRAGLFVVSPDGKRALWRPVRVGIREGGRIQVEGEGLSGRVVTLGQQLIDDGSRITIQSESGTKTTFDGAAGGE